MPIGPIDDIEREPVESSNIAAIGFSAARSTLAVEFKGGDVFHYSPISIELATEFYAAESKGQFYSAYIKYKVPSKLMTGICSGCGELGVLGIACSKCGGTVVERERRRLTPAEKAIEARSSKFTVEHDAPDVRQPRNSKRAQMEGKHAADESGSEHGRGSEGAATSKGRTRHRA